EGDALHLAIGGMIVDPVLIAAEPVARVQYRLIPVRDPRELVEPAARQRAEAVEMPFEARKIVSRKIEPQQIAQGPVDGVEILPRAVRRDVIGAASVRAGFLLR